MRCSPSRLPTCCGGSELTIDARVLFYMVGLSVLTGVIAGLAPAVTVARRPIVESLQASNSRVTHSPRIRQVARRRPSGDDRRAALRRGLLVRTVMAFTNVNHGFEKQGLVTMEVGLPGARYPIERRVAFYRELLTAIEALPGVDSAGGASGLPVIGSPRAGTRFHRLSTRVDPKTQMVDHDYSGRHAEKFPHAAHSGPPGREFTHADDANPTPGFIVNKAFVDRSL